MIEHNFCADCGRCHKPGNSQNFHTWTCEQFQRNEWNEVDGTQYPPRHYCRDVRRYSACNGVCQFFEPTKREGTDDHPAVSPKP